MTKPQVQIAHRQQRNEPSTAIPKYVLSKWLVCRFYDFQSQLEITITLEMRLCIYDHTVTLNDNGNDNSNLRIDFTH